MKNEANPWDGMKPSQKIRVDEIKREFECYWVTDPAGKYGYLVESKEDFELPKNQIKLQGITVTIQDSMLILILEENQNWQIFKHLCEDLSGASVDKESAINFIKTAQIRLKRWQDLLKFARNKSMSVELQMGLFSELSFIKDVLVQKLGIKQALNSWVGPDKDKQDFLLDNFIFEIKSHRTSKSPTASISSAGQLHSEKEPIYLISYALTTNAADGPSIIDLVKEIEVLIDKNDNGSGLIESFHLQLDNYGYNPEFTIERPALKFLIDSMTCYYVDDDFPKLTKIPMEINHLQYGIDLTKCSNFKFDIEEVFAMDLDHE